VEAEAVVKASWRSRAPYLVPGLVVMTLFLVIPLVMVLLVSLWSSKGFTLDKTFTLTQYKTLISSVVFWKVVWSTMLTTAITVVGALAIAFPVSYYIAKIVPERWRMIVFLIAIIPFWTSYLTRMVTFIPLLGRTGVINSLLMRIGVTSQPLDVLLYTNDAQWGVMIMLCALFAVGPIFFSVSKISTNVLEAARTMGARPIQVLRYIILPLTMPGLVTGAVFVIILATQDYATASIIGGGKTSGLASDVMQQASLLQWPAAAARAVVLTALTFGVVAVLLRTIDLRREM
jgi:putative spermidine/putrescine transport system permease protein